VEEDMNSIDASVVVDYREQGLNWKDIAEQVGVSYDILNNWKRRSGFVDTLISLEGDQLVNEIRPIAADNPTIGVICMLGALKMNNFKATRANVRKAMVEIDADAVEQRKKRKIVRRNYKSTRPYETVHIDGHHKLIGFKIVTHAGVDGFSKSVTYMHSSDNNRADTHYDRFVVGVKEGVFPARVRADRGGENRKIAALMFYYRGEGCFFTGRSVHNQPIERLWSDYYQKVTCVYCEMFDELSNQHGLDCNDDFHLFPD